MLMLGRRKGERLRIGDELLLVITHVHFRQASIELWIRQTGMQIELTLELEQTIRLNDGVREIEITLTAVRSGEARFGIAAPKDVSIVREEIAGTDRDVARVRAAGGAA